MEVTTTASAQRARITLYHCRVRSSLTSLFKIKEKTKPKKKFNELKKFPVILHKSKPPPHVLHAWQSPSAFAGPGLTELLLNELPSEFSEAVAREASGGPGAPSSHQPSAGAAGLGIGGALLPRCHLAGSTKTAFPALPSLCFTSDEILGLI